MFSLGFLPHLDRRWVLGGRATASAAGRMRGGGACRGDERRKRGARRRAKTRRRMMRVWAFFCRRVARVSVSRRALTRSSDSLARKRRGWSLRRGRGARARRTSRRAPRARRTRRARHDERDESRAWERDVSVLQGAPGGCRARSNGNAAPRSFSRESTNVIAPRRAGSSLGRDADALSSAPRSPPSPPPFPSAAATRPPHRVRAVRARGAPRATQRARLPPAQARPRASRPLGRARVRRRRSRRARPPRVASRPRPRASRAERPRASRRRARARPPRRRPTPHPTPRNVPRRRRRRRRAKTSRTPRRHPPRPHTRAHPRVTRRGRLPRRRTRRRRRVPPNHHAHRGRTRSRSRNRNQSRIVPGTRPRGRPHRRRISPHRGSRVWFSRAGPARRRRVSRRGTRRGFGRDASTRESRGGDSRGADDTPRRVARIIVARVDAQHVLGRRPARRRDASEPISAAGDCRGGGRRREGEPGCEKRPGRECIVESVARRRAEDARGGGRAGR